MTKAINFACACARAAAKVFHRSEGSTLCRPSPSPRLRSQIATRPTHPLSKPPGQTIKIPQDVAAPHSKALQLIMRIWRIFFPGGANSSTWLTQIRTHTWRWDAVCQFACLPVCRQLAGTMIYMAMAAFAGWMFPNGRGYTCLRLW